MGFTFWQFGQLSCFSNLPPLFTRKLKSKEKSTMMSCYNNNDIMIISMAPESVGEILP